jgi:hypothetical protein
VSDCPTTPCDLCCRPLVTDVHYYLRERDCLRTGSPDCLGEVRARNKRYAVMVELCRQVREGACGPHHSMGNRFNELKTIIDRKNELRALLIEAFTRGIDADWRARADAAIQRASIGVTPDGKIPEEKAL